MIIFTLRTDTVTHTERPLVLPQAAPVATNLRVGHSPVVVALAAAGKAEETTIA